MKPKYLELVDILSEKIENMGHNELIPSERELAKMYNMSRMTVRKSIDCLVAQNKVYRVSNVGTFTTDKKLYKNLDMFTGFTKEVEAAGGKVQNVLIEYSLQKASKVIAQKLQIEEGASVYKIVRLRKKNNVPLIIDESYFSKDLIPLTEKVVEGSIYKYISDVLGLKIVSAEQKLKATFAKEAYLEYLDVDAQTPIIFVELTGYLEDGRVFEYSESYKNSEQYELIVKSYK
ncbi:GntR family transcriptional regulator [Liberiplasma polymorphum]|uniref:GntR family transcriptional regulator n=1 Tax=Liberiplasma polymorphum TaxID=3374570 RepID=UPI00377417BB